MSTFTGAVGGKRSRKNYEAVMPSSERGYGFHCFHYKSDAIAFAIKHWASKGYPCVVKNRRTGQLTNILLKQQCACSTCGNELEGKQHCPLCGKLHYYAHYA